MQKIILIQTAFLGDLLLSIPLLKNIKKYFPNSQISLVCRKGLGSFLKDLGLIDFYYEIEKGKSDTYSDIVSKIKNENFDFLFCPHQSVRTAFLVSRIKSKIKVGYSEWWNYFIFNRRVQKNYNYPDALRQLSLLLDSKIIDVPNLTSQIGFDHTYFDNNTHDVKVKSTNKSQDLHDRIIDFRKMNFLVPEWASMQVDLPEPVIMQVDLSEQKSLHRDMPELSNLQKKLSKPYIVLFPGSVWPTKRWTLSGFASIAKNYVKSHQIIIMGSSSEFDLGEKIISALNRDINLAASDSDLNTDATADVSASTHVTVGTSGDASSESLNVSNLCGKTSLLESYFILKEAEFVLTNDSGSMHLASVANIKTFAIFGPTVLDIGYRPWQNNAVVIEKSDLTCRPCGKHGHKQCPLGHHDCMKKISAETVIKIIQNKN